MMQIGRRETEEKREIRLVHTFITRKSKRKQLKESALIILFIPKRNLHRDPPFGAILIKNSSYLYTSKGQKMKKKQEQETHPFFFPLVMYTKPRLGCRRV